MYEIGPSRELSVNSCSRCGETMGETDRTSDRTGAPRTRRAGRVERPRGGFTSRGPICALMVSPVYYRWLGRSGRAVSIGGKIRICV